MEDDLKNNKNGRRPQKKMEHGLKKRGKRPKNKLFKKREDDLKKRKTT